MVGDILQPTHLLLILLVALLVLGPKRLPEVGRSLGKGIRDFRGAMSGIQEQSSGFLNMEESDSSDESDSSSTDASVNGSVSSEEAASVTAKPAQSTDTATSSSEPVATAEPTAAPVAPESPSPAAAVEAQATPERTTVHEPDPSEYAD